jgi:Uma2 family endonuclease
MATISRSMTEEEFLALPDIEGVERALIRGELVEWHESSCGQDKPLMRTRSFAHSLIIINIGFYLKTWLKTQPKPRGCVVGGEARIRLCRDPLTIVGVDVAYIPRKARPEHPRTAVDVDGAPVLVVEGLSRFLTIGEINNKIDQCLDAGVSIVWFVEPRFSTVTVYRTDTGPQFFNANQEITAEPFLPGFRVAVANFFEGLDN